MMGVSVDECLRIFGYPSVEALPAILIEYPLGSGCRPSCRSEGQSVAEDFATVMCFFKPETAPFSLNDFPAVIELSRYSGYDEFRRYVKGFSDGERLRLIRKAKSQGYFVEHCNLQMHVADRYEIHTSKQMRQGRPLVGMLLKSIDELGGLPTAYIPPEETPACRHYWEQAYGVFLRDASHRQGQVTVNKRLVGYIRLLR